MLSQEWSCSWSATDNFIAYYGASYIIYNILSVFFRIMTVWWRGSTVCLLKGLWTFSSALWVSGRKWCWAGRMSAYGGVPWGNEGPWELWWMEKVATQFKCRQLVLFFLALLMRMDILEIQDMYRDIDMYVLCLESAFHMDYIERYMDFSAGKNIYFLVVIHIDSLSYLMI